MIFEPVNEKHGFKSFLNVSDFSVKSFTPFETVLYLNH